MPENIRSYKQTLFHFLNYIDETNLKVDEDDIPHERLKTLTPPDLLRWFNFKTFGQEDPADDANPTEARSNSIANWKKQLSYFMPNNHHPWNVVAMLVERGLLLVAMLVLPGSMAMAAINQVAKMSVAMAALQLI
jgi:hypothetical protein